MDEKFSLILDANVVIDYCHADENILALSARHLGNVFIPRPILNNEVKELDQKDCERIGLIISDPELDEIIAAGSKRGRLSFYDRLLLIMAKNRNWIGVTNEKCLRSVLIREGVQALWGLELMRLLVERKALSSKGAVRVATAISRENKYITADIVRRFAKSVGMGRSSK